MYFAITYIDIFEAENEVVVFLWCFFVCFLKFRLTLIIVLTLQTLSCTLLCTASATLSCWVLLSCPLSVAHSASLAANCCFTASKSLSVVMMLFTFLLARLLAHTTSLFFYSVINVPYASAQVTGPSQEWKHQTRRNSKCKPPPPLKRKNDRHFWRLQIHSIDLDNNQPWKE